MVRDVANPSTKDPFFPVFRSFDWFHGHSWAKGLFWSGDGKDQESSSEDYNFAFAMKLWGMVSGDGAMEARGNLMLGILKRTVNQYMLLRSDNTTHPLQFIKNMVSGIVSPSITFFDDNSNSLVCSYLKISGMYLSVSSWQSPAKSSCLS